MTPWLYVFSTGAWLCATMVTRSSNPIYSVFYLVLVFFHACAFLFLLGMEFFALMQLLVYVGALAVMFLFVVMLLEIPVASIVAIQRGSLAVAGVFFWIVCTCIFFLIYDSYICWPIVFDQSIQTSWNLWNHIQTQNSNAAFFGLVFYSMYGDLLVLACMILLVAMIGAVILTNEKRVNVPHIDSFSQQNRDFQKILKKIRI